MKNIVPIIVIGVGGYLLWSFYQNQQLAAAMPAGNEPPPPLPPNIATPVTPISVTPLPTPVTTPAAAGAWSQAIQVLKSQAGTNSLNWDQWSYYWQNSPPFNGAPFGFGVAGSISPSMFGTIVGAADHTANTTAEQFVANTQAAISALGLGGYRHRRFA